MRQVLTIVLLALAVAIPLFMPRLVKKFISPPPPLPGIEIPLATTPVPPAITPMPAAERIALVRKKYLDAKSYRDRGEQSTTMSTLLSGETKAVFTTAFERNGREFWAYRESEEGATGHGWLYVVTSTDQNSFRTWWTIDPEVKSVDSHDMAYAGPTGISKGNAVMILPLLRGGSSPFSVSDAAPEDLGVETINGIQCAVLKLSPRGGRIVTLWIDAEHAIRRINAVSLVSSEALKKLDPSTKDFDSFTSTTITSFHPVFDQPIPDEAFAFDPAKLPK